MDDYEIFEEWLNKSIAKYVVTENAQVGYILEFARYYHKKKTKN